MLNLALLLEVAQDAMLQYFSAMRVKHNLNQQRSSGSGAVRHVYYDGTAATCN